MSVNTGMSEFRCWCRVTVVAPNGTVLASRVMGGPSGPDLEAVDAVARLALFGRRYDAVTIVAEASPAMRELLELAALPVEVRGQPE